MTANTPEIITRATVDNITPTRLYGPHDTFLTSLSYSPDAKVLVTADIQGYLRIWGSERGEQAVLERAFPSAVSRLAFGEGANGGYVFTVIAERERVKSYRFDPTSSTVQVVNEIDLTDQILLDVTHAIDGRPVVACVAVDHMTDHRLYLMHGDDKNMLSAFRSGNDNNPNARFSHDGTLVAVGHDDGVVKVRSTQPGGRTVHTIDTGLRGVIQTAFSTDGRKLAVIEDQGDRVLVFDVESGEKLAGPFEITFVKDAVFNVDGSLLVVSTTEKGGPLRLYDAANGRLLRSLRGSSPIGFSPLGNGFIGGNNYALYSKSALLWDERQSPGGVLSKLIAPVDIVAAETYNVRKVTVLYGHEKPVRALAFSPDNSLLASAGEEDEIVLWNMETGGTVAVLTEHKADITGLAFSPDSKTLASSSGYFNNTEDNTVRLWDVDEDTQIMVFNGHGSRVVAVDFGPRGEQVVSAETDGTVLVWGRVDGKIIRRIKTSSTINDMALSSGGALVATAHGSELALKDRTVRLWNVDTGELLQEIDDLEDWAQHVCFSPDGNVVVASDYASRVRGWDVATGTRVKELPTGAVVRYSPKQDLLAIAQSKDLKLTAVQGGQVFMRLRHGEEITAVAFAAESDMLATGTREGEVTIYGVMDRSNELANTEQMDRKRVEAARSGRYVLQFGTLTCVHAQERNGDEVFIRLDGQTVWAVERAGRKMNHKPNRANEVSVFDFRECKMMGRDGWQTTDEYTLEDFRVTGLTGPLKLELWEEDNFLRGGDDFLGSVTLSPSQAGQGEQEAVIYSNGAHYIFKYEVLYA